jgi:large subunit ribosomal protein L13
MKTFFARAETTRHDWYLIDANDRVLGRLATEIARRLRGKHKPVYTPHTDTGDYIVVVNADKVRVTGAKATDKFYHRYSGYQSGMKSISFEKQVQKNASAVIELAVKGMLPKNRLGRAMFKKLKVFNGPEHIHQAQQPQPLDF